MVPMINYMQALQNKIESEVTSEEKKMWWLTLLHEVDFTDVLLLPLGDNTCLTDTI